MHPVVMCTQKIESWCRRGGVMVMNLVKEALEARNVFLRDSIRLNG